MKTLLLTISCIAALTFTNCKKNYLPQPEPSKPEVKNEVIEGYFECSFYTCANPYDSINKTVTIGCRNATLNSYMIDKKGQLHSNTSTKGQPKKPFKIVDSEGYISEKDLIENITMYDSIIKTVPKDELIKYNQLIEPASKGLVILDRYSIAIEGHPSQSYCYQYDKIKQKYKRITLQPDFDREINNSESAKEIDEWLWKSISGQSKDSTGQWIWNFEKK